jgi:hypothetical protein
VNRNGLSRTRGHKPIPVRPLSLRTSALIDFSACAILSSASRRELALSEGLRPLEGIGSMGDM